MPKGSAQITNLLLIQICWCLKEDNHPNLLPNAAPEVLNPRATSAGSVMANPAFGWQTP